MLATACKLALRNLRRHRRRSLLVGLTILVGAAVIVVNHSVVGGIRRQLVENLLVAQSGHLRITAREGSAAAAEGVQFAADLPIEEPDSLRRAIRETLPGAGVSFGLSSSGMILTPLGGSSRVALWGIEPAEDLLLLDGLRQRAIGELGGLEPGSVYLSRKLGQRLQVEPGETITLTVPAIEGEMDVEDFQIAGLVSSGAPWQDYFIYLPLPDLQRLMGTGEAVQEIKVFLPGRPGRLEPPRRRLALLLAERRPDLRVQTYEESGGFFLGIVAANRLTLAVMDLVLLLAVGLGVANVQALSVNERRREIGAMVALGTPRSAVRAIFLVEGAALGFFFGLLGALLGGGLSLVLQRSGISLPAEAFSWIVGGQRLFPQFAWAGVIKALAELTFAAALAGLLPAARAARLDPVEALRGGNP